MSVALLTEVLASLKSLSSDTQLSSDLTQMTFFALTIIQLKTVLSLCQVTIPSGSGIQLTLTKSMSSHPLKTCLYAFQPIQLSPYSLVVLKAVCLESLTLSAHVSAMSSLSSISLYKSLLTLLQVIF